MIYVYEDNGRVVSRRDKRPDTEKMITLARMIPTPVKQGCDAVLCADFKTGKVWYDLVENIEGARIRKLATIADYDTSGEVNSFFFGGVPMWIDRDTRTSLAYIIKIEAANGNTSSTVWYNEAEPPISFEIPIPILEKILADIEVYAKESYSVTQKHRAAVCMLTAIEDIEAYDHTAEYPQKLSFNL